MSTNLKRIIIAAVSQNGIIGSNNRIPWLSKEELQNFRKITLDSPIILGRKTYDSLTKNLERRLNIVISAQPSNYSNNDQVISFSSVGEAYNYLRKKNFEKVYICGGGRIYRNTIKHAEEMVISHMNFKSSGDVSFPYINLKKWEIMKEQIFEEFVVKFYLRKIY